MREAKMRREIGWLKLTLGIFLCAQHLSLPAMEVGVCTHLGQNRVGWNLVRNAMDDLGVSAFRDEIYWKTVERSDRSITISSVPRGMVDALAASPTPYRPMLIADYGHPNYDGGRQPFSSVGRAAYARYARSLLSSYGPKLPYLEIWNEWNLGMGNSDRVSGTPQAYAALFKATKAEISANGASTKILLGAVGDDLNDWSWTKQLLGEGVLAAASGYSVHLYNYMAGSKAVPEEMFARLERLQEILRAANHGSDYPVYVTEVGWPTNIGAGGVSQRLAGAYLSRFLLEASGYGWLKGVWIYDLIDDGIVKTEREHNFGLYDTTGKPKAGTCMVRQAIALLNNFQLVAKGETTNSVRWLQFERKDRATTAFIVFSKLKGGSATLPIKVKASALCEVELGAPKPPRIDSVSLSPGGTVIASGQVAGGATLPTTRIGEEPLLVLLDGNGKGPEAIFFKP